MRFKIAASIFFVMATAISYSAQTRVVTNATLESYKQQRLKAERDYRENYARLGLPSPEELDRRREQSRVETEALSAKLRSESLERERLQMQREAAAQTARYYSAPQQVVEERYQQRTYFWSYGRKHHYPQRQIFYQQPGYFAGGQFWPTGSRTPSRPLIKIQRR